MRTRATTAALLLAASLAGQNNPIGNPGFEAGFDGWTFGTDSGSTWKIEQRDVGLKKDKALVLTLKRPTSGTATWIERTMGPWSPKWQPGPADFFFRLQAKGDFWLEVRNYYPPGPPNELNTFAYFYTSLNGGPRTVTASHPNVDSARPEENKPCRFIFRGEGEVVIDDLAFVVQTTPAVYDEASGLDIWTDYTTSRMLNALLWVSPAILSTPLLYQDAFIYRLQDWWLPPSSMVLLGNITPSTHPIQVPEFLFPYFGQLHFQAMNIGWRVDGYYLNLGSPYTVQAWR